MDKKITMNDLSRDLNPVEVFPGNIFVVQGKEAQEINSVVLSFAQVFNDLRDLELLSKLTRQDIKECEQTSNPLYGQHGGMTIFIDKLYLGFTFEFFELIKENLGILTSEQFARVIKQTNKKTKEDWEYLLNFIAQPDNKLYKILLKLRNNLAFHYYQPKQLFRGFQFISEACDASTYVSFGESMAKTRYYFMDLALQMARFKTVADEEVKIDVWQIEIQSLVARILQVTMGIVFYFITAKCAPTFAKLEKIPALQELLDNASQKD